MDTPGGSRLCSILVVPRHTRGGAPGHGNGITLACLAKSAMLRRSEHLARVIGLLIFFMLQLGAIGHSKGS